MKSEYAKFCRYLQWLIEEQECDEPHYHTSYALSLSRSAMDAVCLGSNNEERNNKEFDSDMQFIYLLRERLQFFLQSSDLYDPEEVLDVISESELWLEKVIIQFISSFSRSMPAHFVSYPLKFMLAW